MGQDGLTAPTRWPTQHTQFLPASTFGRLVPGIGRLLSRRDPMSHFKGAAADEIFVGNCERDSNRVASLQAKGCRTARIGDVAYCIEGKPLPHTWAPLFIGRSEEAVYDDIMMTATFGPNWRRH